MGDSTNGSNPGSNSNGLGESSNTDLSGNSGDSASNDGWLYTSGNHIYLGDNVWMGRGANIHDMRSCNACTWKDPEVGEVNRRLDELYDVWGANFVRLALESYAGAEGYRAESNFKSILDDSSVLDQVEQIVDHIGQKENAYVLVTLWIDPSFTPLGWPTEDTQQIWEMVATRFAHDRHVLFGLVNEPQSNFDGAQDAQVWQAMNDTVQAIRDAEQAAGAPYKHIVSVQGTRAWARYLDYYVDHPITASGGENIVYESHPYFDSGTPPDTDSFYDSLFGDAAQTIPVIIGEYGSSEINSVVSYAEQRQISHLAWTFHHNCAPNLIQDTSSDGCGIGMDLLPTSFGQQLMAILKP
ncbi:MAG: cellulase family glycosylhydrolase [Myxococcales bacterium]|nr:MAG: cellulase family glycosylhydrolase [Myxococcales bacterium]